MAIATYSSYYPTMKPQLPDCPEALILQSLHTATRDFCAESEAFIQEQTGIDLVADQKAYTITVPTDLQLLRVFQVNILSEDDVSNGDDGFVKDPSLYVFEYPDQLVFDAAPSAEAITAGLVNKFVLTLDENPADADSNMDFNFLNRWSQYIKAGAMAELQGQKGKPWFNERDAAKNFSTYHMGVAYARREVRVQFTTRTTTMQGRSFL